MAPLIMPWNPGGTARIGSRREPGRVAADQVRTAGSGHIPESGPVALVGDPREGRPWGRSFAAHPRRGEAQTGAPRDP